MCQGFDEDYEIVKQCQDGSRKAFGLLVVKYQEKVFKKCFYLMNKDKDEAEDAAQEVFLKIYKNISTFEGGSKFSTWLYSIMKNHCLNIIKRKNISPVIVDRDGILVQLLADKEDFFNSDAIDKECVHQKIEGLTAKYRNVIETVHFEELSYDAAAKKLDCPVGTIRSRLSRALKKIAPLVKECINQPI